MIISIILLGICILLGVVGIFDYKVKDMPKTAEPKTAKKVIVKQKNKQSKNTSK